MRDERVRSRCDIAVTETPLVGCDEASSVRVRTLGSIENDSLPDRRSTRVDRESGGRRGAAGRAGEKDLYKAAPLISIINYPQSDFVITANIVDVGGGRSRAKKKGVSANPCVR